MAAASLLLWFERTLHAWGNRNLLAFGVLLRGKIIDSSLFIKLIFIIIVNCNDGDQIAQTAKFDL